MVYQIHSLIKKSKKLTQLVNRYLGETKLGRNELCSCNSGKKYKKCCLIKNNPEQLESLTINFNSISTPEVESLSDKDLNTLQTLYQMTIDEAEDTQIALESFISKHPNIPCLYNYLFITLRKTSQEKKAFELLKKIVQKFPKYLFGLIEYSFYFLRRGEPEKAIKVFDNKKTLSQFYLNRTEFHASEVIVFSYFMALYFVEIEKFNNVTGYYQSIKMLNPDAEELSTIKYTIRSKLLPSVYEI